MRLTKYFAARPRQKHVRQAGTARVGMAVNLSGLSRCAHYKIPDDAGGSLRVSRAVPP